MKDLNYILTTNSISIDFDDKYFIVNQSDSKKYNSIKKLLQSKSYDEIVELLVPAKRVMVYANDFFSIDESGNLFMMDEPTSQVPAILSNKLMDFISEKLPIEPLVKFWKKLRNNPSEDSKQDLYSFLEKNNHPITPEGNFIAYKKVKTVDGVLKDSHTGKIDNSIGASPAMKREDVDADRNKTCSSGLHVASMNYANNFSGNILVKVAVDPSNVVAVPVDYNREKMRVCKYTVVAVMNDTKNISKNKQILDKIPKSKDLNKVNITPISKGVVSASSYYEADSSLPKNINLNGLTAREIVYKTHQDIKIKINTPLKNKQTILKKAKKYYEMKGHKVTI